MWEYGSKSKKSNLYDLGIKSAEVYWNLSQSSLYEIALKKEKCVLTDSGALMVDTGYFTGRSPKDKYLVRDDITKDTVNWGEINQAISPEVFDEIYKRIIFYIYNKTLYVRYGFGGADSEYQLPIQFINTLAWQNLFCYNMFIRPSADEIKNFLPEWTIISVPEFQINTDKLGLNNPNFTLVNMSKKIVLIGGSAYAGEIKKSIFSIFNFILPQQKNILSMHASANIGEKQDTAVFFGLSGTGKTTLSTDQARPLIGDDEHGWSEKGIFNFEGGCYAKVIDLSKEKEPDIWEAIKFGAILENTRFYDNSRDINYADTRVTENTRVSYPIYHIKNATNPSIGTHPKNIFFLTCDAYGIIPPIAKLTPSQAMYHFISGYTSKVAGTEMGIKKPTPTFSACFGAAFIPLHPSKYAELLGQNMTKYSTNVWIINTGWSNGSYEVGSRIKLDLTRKMITAALNGDLDKVEYTNHTVFKFEMPLSCKDIPSDILSPRKQWNDDEGFYKTAYKLSKSFHDNFKKYEKFCSKDILDGAPYLMP